MSVSDYNKNTQVMLGVVDKFLKETDASKLHKVASYLQLSRAVTCTDVNNECTLYTDLIRSMIKFSEDGSLSLEEKSTLKKQRGALKAAIDLGRKRFK